MIQTETINIQPTNESRLPQLDFESLVFGRTFSDHMLVMDFKDGKWQKPSILPYQNLSMSPASSVIHYGQSIFEGLKAFKNENGDFGLFRPDRNIDRMNKSAVRMCMPELPTELVLEGLKELVRLDQGWIPTSEMGSLYIRPVLFATDEYIGVKASDTYRFLIFTAPVNAYYTKPVKVKIERNYTRAAHGGTGAAKAAGNYAGSLYPARLANQQGYDQLLWTDAQTHSYIEESGTMNVMFLIDDTLITPALSDTILDGITRSSVLELARSWGMKVEERKVSVQEITDAAKEGRLKDAFGCGTAATIAQIASIADGDQEYVLPEVEEREFSKKLSNYFIDLKKFRIEDSLNWMIKLN